MKNLSILSIIAVVALVVVADELVWQGAGAFGTATTTPTVVRVPGTNYAYRASIRNLGSAPIFFTKASTTNGFVVTNGIQIATNDAYTCVGDVYYSEQRGRAFTGIVIATTNGTSEYTIAFE